jgi:predicted alpha/beta superfamily hydrolase
MVASAHVEARRVQVWLPPGYRTQPQRRWRVLYLHDGQNVFDAQAAGSEWRFDETAQRLALEGLIDPPLIVAIDSTAQRIHDYTPTAAPAPARAGATRAAGETAGTWGGGAAAYARFLWDELKPLIDARYRTRPGPADTAVGGASLGGLVSLWLALEHPQRVGAALVVSPSLWWDGRWALRRVQALGPGTTEAQTIQALDRPRLWLDIGWLEGDTALADTRALRDALRAQGWADARMVVTEDPMGTHSELSWAGRVEGMLRFLYGR